MKSKTKKTLAVALIVVACALISELIVSQPVLNKGIVIGKNGEMIKKIGQDARREIERLTDRKIFLELRVKVMKNWRNDENLLRQLGIKRPED